jgi:hypothetical protein
MDPLCGTIPMMDFSQGHGRQQGLLLYYTEVPLLFSSWGLLLLVFTGESDMIVWTYHRVWGHEKSVSH